MVSRMFAVVFLLLGGFLVLPALLNPLQVGWWFGVIASLIAAGVLGIWRLVSIGEDTFKQLKYAQYPEPLRSGKK